MGEDTNSIQGQSSYERGRETGSILAALQSIEKKIDGLVLNYTALELRTRALEQNQVEVKGAWKATIALASFAGGVAAFLVSIGKDYFIK